MRYVVDANVAVKWFLKEPYSNVADTLLRDFLVGGLGLGAPDIITAEVGNTFWKRCVIFGDMSVEEARDSYRDFMALNLPIHGTKPIAQMALNLATKENHNLYDTFYLALALDNNCELITADQRLINKLGSKFPQIRWLGSLSKS